jgi:tRNA(fMet)-specific endonuclease VapC
MHFMYLLDTNACICILNNRSPVLPARVSLYDPSELCLCAITKAELVFGAYKSARPAENLRLLQDFFAPYLSLPFDDACISHYGRIRADLQRQGNSIGGNDLLIAATALANDAVLVTANTREFGRVVGLRLEDWEKE